MFYGLNLFIFECIAKKNNGFEGGFILIESSSSKLQNISIRKCIFTNNMGGNGAVIAFAKSLKNIKAEIRNNYFRNNFAGCIN